MVIATLMDIATPMDIPILTITTTPMDTPMNMVNVAILMAMLICKVFYNSILHVLFVHSLFY